MELAYSQKFVAVNETDLVRVKKKSGNRRCKVKFEIKPLPKPCVYLPSFIVVTLLKLKVLKNVEYLSPLRDHVASEPVNQTS